MPKGFQNAAIVAQNRPSSRGKTTFCVIEEFKVDAALLRAIRRLEELVARELGQWGNDDEYTRVGLQNAALKLTPQQVEAEVERILAKGKSRRRPRRRVRESSDAPSPLECILTSKSDAEASSPVPETSETDSETSSEVLQYLNRT